VTFDRSFEISATTPGCVGLFRLASFLSDRHPA
jgi:hypothetical protein